MIAIPAISATMIFDGWGRRVFILSMLYAFKKAITITKATNPRILFMSAKERPSGILRPDLLKNDVTVANAPAPLGSNLLVNPLAYCTAMDFKKDIGLGLR